MEDNYSHIEESLIYILENIPGPIHTSNEYRTLLENFESQITNHCNCDQICTKSLCICVMNSGGVCYINGKLQYDTDRTHPVFECNSLCPCSIYCGNRIVQKGPVEGLTIARCVDTDKMSKGLGIFTSRAISSGTFICEYAGEVITKSEAMKRHSENKKYERMNYIFCLNEHSNGNVTQTFIDPSQFGNIGRYINHSCEPNCQIVPVRVDSLVPKLAIFACEDIPPGAEITFNYGALSNDEGTATEGERKPCLCGAALCSGWMPFQSY